MLDEKEERELELLRRECRRLKVLSPPQILIRLEKFRDGEKIFDDVQRGHSWTRNYYNFAFGCLAFGNGGNSNNFGVGYMSGKRTSGTIDYSGIYPAYSQYGVTNYTALSATYGVVVGSDDTAFDEDQYALISIIANGTSAGNLLYGAMPYYPDANYDAGTDKWTSRLNRTFHNQSGGNVTVKETGLYLSGVLFSSSAQTYMVERTVLSPSIVVADLEILRVTYDISVDFSAIDS
jgi:hypothetical protein